MLSYWAEQIRRHEGLPNLFVVGTHADHFPYSYARFCYPEAEEKMKELRSKLDSFGITLNDDRCFILGKEDRKKKVDLMEMRCMSINT